MEAATEPVATKRRGVLNIALRTLAIVLALFILLIAAFEMRKVGVPGVPAIWAYVGLGFAIVTLLLQLPPIFYRLQRWGRIGASLMLPGAVIVFGVAAQEMDPAWSKSPAGIREAAAAVEMAKRDAAERVERQKEMAAAQAEQQIADEKEAKQRDAEAARKAVEACFSTFAHRLPALEQQVKDGLENPHSFEHVKTVATDPDYYGHNVEMTLRAQNGFGAIRTATVTAKINPTNCSVEDVSSVRD